MATDKDIDNLHKLLHEMVAFKFEVQKIHWNVTGPNFISIHNLLGDIYEEVELAIDDVAEQIRRSNFLGDNVAFELDKVSDACEDIKNRANSRGFYIDNSEPFQGRIHLNHVSALNEVMLSGLRSYRNQAEDGSALEDLFIARIKAHEQHRYLVQSHLV